MAQSERLRGIFTPNLVPLDDAGEIQETELRRYIDWLIERGVHGLYPNGSTGEFTRFRADERRRCNDPAPDRPGGVVLVGPQWIVIAIGFGHVTKCIDIGPFVPWRHHSVRLRNADPSS